MPSSASDVSATLSFTSAQWQQAPTPAQQETDSHPFAALLDANTTAPEAMTAPANPPQPNSPQTTAQQPSSALGVTWQYSNRYAVGDADSSTPATATTTAAENLALTATAGSKPATLGAGSTALSAAAASSGQADLAQRLTRDARLKAASGDNSTATPPQGASNASAQATGASNASATTPSGGTRSTPSPSANGVPADANPAGTANDPTPGPDAASTDIVAASAVADRQSATPTSATTTSRGDGKDTTADDADSGTADADSQGQPATNTAQPIAAAVVVNAPVGIAPTPSGTTTASATIGQPGKGHASWTATTTGNQGASKMPEVPDATATKQGPMGAHTESSANSGSSPSGDGSAAANPSSAQSGPTQGTDNNAAPQAGGPVSADTDHTAAQPIDLSGAVSSAPGSSSSTTQNATGIGKPSADGLPNFGFSPSVTAAASSSAATTPAGASAAPAVPIAGLAVFIAARAQAGSNQFDIRLDPPELGRIDVHLDVDSSGQVTTQMTADRADTLSLLQSQQPQLEQALQQAGLKTADNGLQFTLRDQSFAGQQNGNGSNLQPSGSAQLVIPDPDLTPVVATQVYTRVGRGSGVDIRV